MTNYSAAHRHVRTMKGAPSEYDCVICSRRPADDWAYVSFRVGGERKPYSDDPDDYQPMCRRCHKSYDLALIRLTDRHPGDVTLW